MVMITDADILAARPPKQRLDPWQPYAFLVEPERTASGVIEDVATIFLTNKECPFRCTMCDLWKYTLDERVPLGAIPAQIDHALERLPAAKHSGVIEFQTRHSAHRLEIRPVGGATGLQ